MILIYHLKSLTDEYSIILATWPFGEPPPPSRGLLADPLPPCWPRGFWMPPYVIQYNDFQTTLAD